MLERRESMNWRSSKIGGSHRTTTWGGNIQELKFESTWIQSNEEML